MMRSHLTGIACFAFLCGGIWVLEYGRRRNRVKHDIDIDTDHIEEREDRISQLPDDVLSLIVSRLHTRAAVRTSILSRRWKHVYTLITEVGFFCSMMYNGPSSFDHEGEKLSQLQSKFVRAVDTFLQHHSGSKIMSFELNCCFRGLISDSFRKWMNSIGGLGVEELTLGFCSTNRVLKSNPPVFSSDFIPSLKRLSLKGGSFQTPNQNALRDLELIFVSLTSEAVECILSNCSSLQSFKLKFCVLPSKLRIRGPNLQLKSLTLNYSSNVEEMDFFAVNLITFRLCHRGMLALSFSYLPLLQNFFIYVSGGEIARYVFGKVAKDLPHLKCMFFQTEASSFEGYYKMVGVTSMLSNLRELVLSFECKNNLDLLSVATILDVCPLLHKFHLSMEVPSRFNGKRAEKRVTRLHTHLKEVAFSTFYETENEYNFILYILKNVVFLQRLSIFVQFKYYDNYFESWQPTIQGMTRRNIELFITGCKDRQFLRMLRLLSFKRSL